MIYYVVFANVIIVGFIVVVDEDIVIFDVLSLKPTFNAWSKFGH